MGLPLFIAKTESDLPTKASGKDAVLAPTNAGVQSARSRHRRVVPPSQAPSNEREARWRLEHTRGGRRFMRLIADENSRATAIPQVTLERIAALDTTLDPIDQAMDEYLQLDFQQRRRWTGELQQLLGPRWTQDGLRARARIMALRNARARAYAPSDLRSRAAESLGTWTAEPRPQARRARVVSPVSSETEAHPNALSPSELARLRQLIEGMQRHRRGPRSNLPDDAPELSLREWTRLSNASRQSRMLDGLGDRQRSMSPEMWDTLLSTMTPDPEPPSVSTSFATAQSQDTAATSFSVPDELRDMEGFLSEPPCEYSDPEDEDPLGHAPPPETQRREGAPSEGPFALRRAVSLTSARRNALRRRVEGRSDNEGPSDTGPGSEPRSRPLQDGWVGSLSVGASDDAATQPSRGTRRPAASRHNEDDWAGMQLIVQGLAQREDIPDEWWLEVGLSRTLGGDGDA